MERKKHLPVYGVGPIYVAAIIIMTVIGVILSSKGLFGSGRYDYFKIPFLIMGIVFIACGVILWVSAALLEKIDTNISANHLVTTGAYAYVRNPLYSAFMLACTGVILCFNNLWLLILPIVFWGFMTLLMKNTEEKWLRNLYGQEYINYCSHVNRCLPWFRR